MVASSYAVGRVQAGEADSVITNGFNPVGRRAVIYCHQAGGSALTPLSTATDGTRKLVAGIAEVGFPVSAQDQGGTAPWGNTTAQTRVGQQRTWMQAAPVSAAEGKVGLLGISQGAVAMFNWAKANPTLVSCMVGVLPVCDLTDIYTNNREGVRGAIETAWGVTYPAALPAGADPAIDTSALVGIPTRLYYTTDDTIVLPATVTTMATAIGGTAVSLGALGHGDAAVAAVDRYEVADFFRQYAA